LWRGQEKGGRFDRLCGNFGAGFAHGLLFHLPSGA
jgi:hypothetical protein